MTLRVKRTLLTPMANNTRDQLLKVSGGTYATYNLYGNKTLYRVVSVIVNFYLFFIQYFQCLIQLWSPRGWRFGRP